MKTTVSKIHPFIFPIALVILALIAVGLHLSKITEEHTFKAEEVPLWLKIEGPLSADKFITKTTVHISTDGTSFHNMEILQVVGTPRSQTPIGWTEVQLLNWRNNARYTLYFTTLHVDGESEPSSFKSISFKGYANCPDGICSLEEVRTHHRVDF